MTSPENPPSLDGTQLRDALMAASQYLRSAAASIDAINVYPVPDGDTGTNMTATMRAALDEAMAAGAAPTVTQVLTAVARGALYGARGNSGVILSQALRGFGQGAGERERLDGRGLANGLQEAAAAAYRVVSRPVEGTMLTVLRAAGEAATAAAGKRASFAEVLAGAVQAAEATEERTIDMLPALREAGVPDAGGEGICAILRGFLAAVTGAVAPIRELPSQPIAMLAGHSGEEFGFCTEFIIEPREGGLDLERLRELVSAPGHTSLVLVGDERAAHVHVHTLSPDPLLVAVEALGAVSRVKVESMDAQHARFLGSARGAAGVALLALSRGAGFDAIFRGLGASVSDLGEVVKPPAGEIAAAADALGAPEVIVLANHKNVVLAAQQAAEIAGCKLLVVPTESLTEGIAAALVFDPETGARENAAAMERARGAIRTIEVTIAAADRASEGLAVQKGDAIALLDGRLVAANRDPVQSLLTAFGMAAPGDGALITLYYGQDAGADAAECLGEAIRDKFPYCEFELVDGGQPLYLFIASVE